MVHLRGVLCNNILWTYQIYNPNIIKCISQYIGEYIVIKYLLRLQVINPKGLCHYVLL